MRRTLVGSGGVLAGLGLVAMLASVRCADVDRGLGQACIRNEDCQSGVCAGQVCIAEPPVFDAAPQADAAGDGSATPDGGALDAARDAAKPVDAGAKPHDAGHVVHDAARDAPATHDAADAAPATDGDATDALQDARHDSLPG